MKEIPVVMSCIDRPGRRGFHMRNRLIVRKYW